MKQDTSHICVFGAANIDITGFPLQKLVYKDANIGKMETTAGGVGRNIAENLSKLGFTIDFISAFGDDLLSEFLINDCRNKGINIDKSLFLKDKPASSFIAIMNHQNDLAVGVSAMELYDDMQPGLFLKNLPEIQAGYCVLETNLSADILQGIIEKYPSQKFVLDTVSGHKALRAKNLLQHLYILKTNLLEAEMISGLKVKTKQDYQKLLNYFLNKGVQKIFITLGEKGVIFADKEEWNVLPAIPSKVVNTIGAGDAFVAGLVYADSLHKSVAEMARYGSLSAAFTVQHKNAVHPDINPKIFKENE